MSSPKFDSGVEVDDFSVGFTSCEEIHDPVSLMVLEETLGLDAIKQNGSDMSPFQKGQSASSPVLRSPHDEGSVSSEEKEPSPKEIRMNRARMTILHYLLAYPQWSISLFMFFASLTTPIPTAKNHIWKPLENLRVVIDNEAMLYHECVQSGFQNHDLRMNQAVLLEQKRIAKYRTDVVRPRIDEIVSTSSKCFNESQSAQRALQTWNNTLGQAIPDKLVRKNAHDHVCTTHDRQVLSELVSGNMTAVDDNIQEIFYAYTRASLNSMHNLVQYSKARSSYDYDYFVGLKVQSTILLLDRFTMPSVYVSLPEQHLILELRGILQNLLDALRGAYVHIDVLSARLLEFEASITAFRVNYMDLHGRFDLINGFIRDFLPSGFSLPDYFDVSGVPLPNSLLPSHFSIPLSNGAFPNIDDLVSQYIRETLKLMGQVLQDAVQEATNQTRRAVEELLESLRDTVLLEDYDPPKYPQTGEAASPDEEIDYVTKSSEATKSDLLLALGALNNLSFESPEIEIFSAGDSNMTVNENQTNFQFLDLTYPEIGVPKWLLGMVSFFLSYGFLIECVTQAYRLRSLRRKYEKNATPELPNIDYLVESDDSYGNETSHVYKVQAAQFLLFKHLMNPWVIIGLILAPTLVFILFFWFPHVKNSCISSQQGTFMARKVFTPVLINKANFQGYALHLAAQSKCFSRQHSICNKQMLLSDSTYRSDLDMLHVAESRYNESTLVRGIVSRCVEIKALDHLFNFHCCGLEGYSADSCAPKQQWRMCPIDAHSKPFESFRPIGELLFDPSCSINFSNFGFMHESLFDCSVIEKACGDVPCRGVDANLIERMTVEADCSVESYVIKICIFLSLAVYHAIMINIMNRLLFDGLLQIRWKRFKPDGIKLITQINGEGQMMKGADIQERAARVDRVMKRYVLAGYIQLVLGILVFTVWVKTFLYLQQATARWNVDRG
jgi:hypothetical protein